MIRNSITTASLTLGLAACLGMSRAPAVPPVPDRPAILALLDTAGVPGLSVALVSAAGPRWATGFGLTSAMSGSPVDEHTVFEAASLSKPVTAYAALKLVDRGLLFLDRPLSEYLPHPDLAGDPRAAQITLRTILSHTTGLQNERIGADSLKFQFNPGDRFRYSGEAFNYLGIVMERIVGIPFAEIMAREVFIPLGMTRSSFVWLESYSENTADGHNSYNALKSPSRPLTPKPGASLHTTAHDYARFLAAMVKGAGLSRRLHKEMIEPQVRVADNIAWGLGWALEQTPSGWALWHHGDNSNSGFTALTFWYPDKQTALVYLANSTAGLGIASRLLELIGPPFGAHHPALRWIDVKSYDAPASLARREVEKEIGTADVAAGLRHFDRLLRTSARGSFDDSFLNDLGYRFVSLGRMEDALAIFEANVKYFPKSFNAYDSLGETYAAVGNYEAALKNYERSVELNPDHNHGKKMIRELREKVTN